MKYFEVTMVAAKTSASQAKKAVKEAVYKEGQYIEVPHTSLVIRENIRENYEVVDLKLLESIRVKGLQDPLQATPKLVLLDGHCRITALNHLAQERGVESIPVKVLIRDVADNDIALFQYTSGHDRKNPGAKSTINAVTRHAEKNPELTDKELSVIFQVSPSTVMRCTRIQRVPALKQLVSNSLVTQNAAVQIIEFFLNESGLDQENISSEDQDGNQITNAYTSANKLGEELVSNISASLANETENKKPFTPWTLRNVNAYLGTIGEPLIPTKDNKEGENKAKKWNLIALVQNFITTAEITPTADGQVSLNGLMQLDQFEALKEMLQERKKGTLVEENSTAVGEETIDTWREFKKQYPNAVVVVQCSSTRYRTYETDIKTLQENLKIEPVIEDGHNTITLGKKDLRSYFALLLGKCIDVVRINKTNVESRNRKSNEARKLAASETKKTTTPLVPVAETESIESDPVNSQIQLELEQLATNKEPGIETVESAPAPNPMSKLDAKLQNNQVIETIDEDDEDYGNLLTGKTASGYEAFMNDSDEFSDDDDEE